MSDSTVSAPVHFTDLDKQSMPGSDSWVRQMGPAMGARELGFNLVELAPGESFCPYHYHLGNEEALFVLEGQGQLRLADGEHTVRAGHFTAFPRGPKGAHKLQNDSEGPLRVLFVSTMMEPDVCIYPDSRKANIFGGSAPGGDRDARHYAKILDEDAELDYWDRESR